MANDTDTQANNDGQDQKPEFENKVKITDAGPCKKKISVEIPEAAIKSSMDEQYKELKADAVVPGFRRGRAPMRLLEKRFGSDIGQQVKLKLLVDASDRAIKDNELDVLGDPDVDHEKIELPESGDLKFDFEVEVRPEFELPELEGIAIEKPKIDVTDTEIDEEVKQMCERAGIWTPKKDGKVADGDQVVADVVLVIEGVEEHEKRDNIEIFARERGFVAGISVDGLDKLLKGAKSGDVKKTSVEVPETYFNEQYRGKKVDVEIEVKEVKALEAATLDEDFLKKFGMADEDELRDSLREGREGQAERDARESMASQIHEYLLSKIKIDLPASIVADQSMRIMQRQYTNMLIQGVAKEQIDAQMQDLQASSEDQAKDQMKQFFVMSKVAEILEIEVNDEEVNGYVAQVAAQRGSRPEKMREELARDGSLAQFALQIREQKSIEKLLETAKITEVDKVKTKKKTAKKKTAKKAEPKKTETKKATAKKTETKKTETKKTTAKKTETKKAVAKKAEPKKAVAKTAKKTETKKPAAKAKAKTAKKADKKGK